MGRHEVRAVDYAGRKPLGAVYWSECSNAWLKRTGVWGYEIVATDEDVHRARAAVDSAYGG